jgi:hypothetical protein
VLKAAVWKAMSPVWVGSPTVKLPWPVMQASSASVRLMPGMAPAAPPTVIGRDGSDDSRVTLPVVT